MGKKSEALLERMKRARGYLYPEWEMGVRLDPDFFEAYDGLYRQALAKDAGLPVKYRELVALGILAFRGVDTSALVNHVRRAYQHGATRQEVLGALEATVIPGGAVTFLHGLRALAQVEGEGRSSPPAR
jgi:alkylhydroperoxidase/carboxymuconolactone decarboxylase family protein YurZ